MESIAQNKIASTMNSVEIAELVGSRHDNVKRAIERLAKSEVIQLPPLERVENKQSLSQNKFADAYIFSGEKGKRDSIIVVAQLCPEFTARLVDRWQELEAKVATFTLPNFADPVEAARAWADEVEQKRIAKQEVIALQSKVEETKPVVEAFDRIALADGSLNMTEAAKTLQVRPIDLRRWLHANRWIYRRNGSKNWLGYQDRIQSGLIEHKINTYEKDDGSQGISEQARITPKGLTVLAKALSMGDAA